MKEDTQEHEAFVGLGSNMGDSAAHLRRAVAALRALSYIRLVEESAVYLTEPQGEPDQPWFANQVVRLVCSSSITSDRLLDDLQAIEDSLGRVRDPQARYGPRVIDLDLLLFDAEVRTDPRLTLPHPRLNERAFVLVPLQALAPDLCLPCGRNPGQLLTILSYRVDGCRIFQSAHEEHSA